MALTACRECGQQISTPAEQCPSCGARRKRFPAKLVLLLAIFGFSCFVFSPADDVTKHLIAPNFVVAPPSVSTYAGLSSAEILRKAGALNERWTQANLPGHNEEWLLLKSQDIADARSALNAVPEGDPQKSQADLALARLDKRQADRDAINALATRKAFAGQTENALLSKGMSVTVTAEGSGARTLRVKYVLTTKALAYQIRNQTDFVTAAYALGFQRVILDDKYGKQYIYTSKNRTEAPS